MATRAKLVTAPLNTSLGLQTITGAGFAPEVAFVMLSNLAGATSAANQHFCFGGIASVTESASISFSAEDGVTGGDNGASTNVNNAPFFRIIDQDSVTLARANLDSFTSDGMIIDLTTTAPTAAYLLHVLFLASDTPTVIQAKAGYLIANTIVGNQNVTGLGFDSPDAVLFMSSAPVTGGTISVGTGNLSPLATLGWAAGGTQACVHFVESHGANPTNTKRSFKTNRCCHVENNTTVLLSFSYVAGIVGGFQINIATTNGSAHRIPFIALKNVSAKVLNADSSVGTGVTPVTGASFTAAAVLAATTATINETNNDTAKISVGMATGPTVRVTHASGAIDNLAGPATPSDVSQKLGTDALLLEIAPKHGSPSDINKWDLSAITPTGISYDHEVANGAPVKMTFLLIGPSSGGAQTFTPTGIASAQAFGTPTVFSGSAAQTFSPTGIPSAQAFGTPVFGGAKLFQPTGIRGPDYKDVELTGTFDDVAFDPQFTQYKVELINGPDPRSAFVQFGTSTHVFLGVAPGDYTSRWSLSNAAGTVLANTQTDTITVTNMGTPAFVVGGGGGGFIILPTGIPSAQSFGNPFFNSAIAPTGIPTGEAFGTPTFATGGLAFLPTGIPSGEVFGTPTFLEHQIFFVVGIPSEEAFGNTLIEFEGAQTLNVPGIETGEAFGTPIFAVPEAPPVQWPPIEDPHTVWIRIPRGREG